ncbi:MAG: hypothetical protein ACRD5H_09940, partial [Nitrososphaerales archaeon]
NKTETDRRSANINPLALPNPWWYEVYQRIKLTPWWLSYNFGVAKEAVLKDKIIRLATDLGLQENWVGRVVRHAVSEFSKKGLGHDYYGYHTIDHELEATYFTLLVAKGLRNSKLGDKDINYLFVSALFHDFDPLKEFDKPNEESIEWFLRHDPRIENFIKEVGISIDVVMALIHRTAYPFQGEIKEKTMRRIQELLTSASIPEHDISTRRHYENLGWLLSVSERIAGYALGDFARSTELAKRNAHALGWHPSVINVESVKYFSILKEEKEIVDLVLQAVPEDYRKRFHDNVAAFKEAWDKEMEIRSMLLKKQLVLIPVVEEIHGELSSALRETLVRLYRALPPPIRVEENNFLKTLTSKDTLLVTLRLNNERGTVVGYAKGGPLEDYKLRKGTHDENMGRHNTIYLEAMSMEPGYWGVKWGHKLRLKFLSEVKKKPYRFLSAYAHRNVIEDRMTRGEPIDIVRKYDPDKLDYYRLNLAALSAEYLLSAATEEELQGKDSP